MKAIVVTGATGFIGSHFINAIADRYPGWKCCALVRGEDTRQAAERLNRSLRLARQHESAGTRGIDFDEQNIALGDIQAEYCGLSIPTAARLARENVEDFWHFASSLNFEEERRDHIRAHNIGGAMNSVKLAIALKCRRFIYVSTAYTAGELQGQIPEQIHGGITFNNYYEETKNEAERLIQALCHQHGIGLVILRPSIVIGPMSTKKTGGSNTGLYGFVREMMRMRRLISRRGGKLRIAGDPDARLNLIPVDYLIADICHIIDNGLRDGSIYHLSSQDTPTVGQCVGAIAEVLGMAGVSVERFDRASASTIEKTASARTTFYAGYMGSRKEFARSIPMHWRVTPEDIREFVREFVKEGGAGISPVTLNKRKANSVLASPASETADSGV